MLRLRSLHSSQQAARLGESQRWGHDCFCADTTGLQCIKLLLHTPVPHIKGLPEVLATLCFQSGLLLAS